MSAEPPTTPGEAPPGMDPVTWRSQLQARDMTGHGRWPDTTTTTTNRDGAEPMNDTTRAAASGRAHETESETEQQMRADFMYAWRSISKDPREYDPAHEIDYSDYSDTWVSDEYWLEEWAYLSTAAHRWQRNPAREARALDVNKRMLSPIRARSEEQARYIADHGIERDEYGVLTSHYNTRVENRDPGHEGTGGSALADYRPGNAVAERLANSERDGVER